MTAAPVSTLESVRAAVAAGDFKRAGDLLEAALRADPDCGWAYAETIELLRRAGRAAEAECVARRALARLPDDACLHGQFGRLLCERNELPAGEWHLRRALERGERTPALLVYLGLSLVHQGRPAEAEACYAEADRTAPGDARTLAYWSKACEVQHDLARAQQLLERAAAAGTPRDVDLLQAQYLARTGDSAQALAMLDAAPVLHGDALLERGRLRDRAGRHAEAWADWVGGKQQLAAEAGGLRYDAAGVQAFFDRLVHFFVRPTYARLPRAPRRRGVPQPVFVLGFPRSGTTLVEQVLGAHPQVRPGGELPFATEWPEFVNRLLPGRDLFPHNLAQTLAADRRHVATLLRDYYFARAEEHRLLEPGAAHFVDKAPFNELWLPLIRLAFPEAPVVHLVRHPHDVCVSMLSQQLNHGYHCGYRLEDIARHLAAVHRVQDHYRRELDAAVFTLRYESLVAEPRPTVARLLEHLGLPWDEACLRHHERTRHAPTPSYAQVAAPINDRSVGRHRAYVRELEPVQALLAPLVAAWEQLD